MTATLSPLLPLASPSRPLSAGAANTSALPFDLVGTDPVAALVRPAPAIRPAFAADGKTLPAGAAQARPDTSWTALLAGTASAIPFAPVMAASVPAASTAWPAMPIPAAAEITPSATPMAAMMASPGTGIAPSASPSDVMIPAPIGGAAMVSRPVDVQTAPLMAELASSPGNVRAPALAQVVAAPDQTAIDRPITIQDAAAPDLGADDRTVSTPPVALPAPVQAPLTTPPAALAPNPAGPSPAAIPTRTEASSVLTPPIAPDPAAMTDAIAAPITPMRPVRAVMTPPLPSGSTGSARTAPLSAPMGAAAPGTTAATGVPAPLQAAVPATTPVQTGETAAFPASSEADATASPAATPPSSLAAPLFDEPETVEHASSDPLMAGRSVPVHPRTPARSGPSTARATHADIAGPRREQPPAGDPAPAQPVSPEPLAAIAPAPAQDLPVPTADGTAWRAPAVDRPEMPAQLSTGPAGSPVGAAPPVGRNAAPQPGQPAADTGDALSPGADNTGSAPSGPPMPIAPRPDAPSQRTNAVPARAGSRASVGEPAATRAAIAPVSLLSSSRPDAADPVFPPIPAVPASRPPLEATTRQAAAAFVRLDQPRSAPPIAPNGTVSAFSGTQSPLAPASGTEMVAAEAPLPGAQAVLPPVDARPFAPERGSSATGPTPAGAMTSGATTTGEASIILDQGSARMPAGPASTALSPAPRTAPAFRAFAAALFEAARPRAAGDPAAGGTDPLAAMTPSATPFLTDAAAVPASPAHDPAAPPLDLAHPGWPGAMVDRIARLRDEADAGDTRIRLLPDALGTIDVSLRRDGETVHLAFRADRAETRQLLADARPELTILAESRGLKLGEAAIGSGSGAHAGFQGGGSSTGAGSDRAPRQQHAPAAPAPTPSRTVVAATADDTRIA